LTTIDCENHGRGFYFHTGEGADSVVDGFTITNGHAVWDYGGGIWCHSSSPTITGCTISGNSAEWSDGGFDIMNHEIYLQFALQLRFKNNQFSWETNKCKRSLKPAC